MVNPTLHCCRGSLKLPLILSKSFIKFDNIFFGKEQAGTCERGTAVKEFCISDTKCCRKSISPTRLTSPLSHLGGMRNVPEWRGMAKDEERSRMCRPDMAIGENITLQLEIYN